MFFTFFKLYKWYQIAQNITTENKQTYSQSDGSWQEVTPSKINKFFDLLLYEGLVQVSTYHQYWSTKSLHYSS